jgi:hypothetical protein
MKLEYYYDNNKNAKTTLQSGVKLAIIFTIIFIISRNRRVEYIGIVGFIIECTAFFLLIFSLGVVTALINCIVNRIHHSRNKEIIELGQLCNAYITGASCRRDYFSMLTGEMFVCELSIEHEPDLFRVTGLTLNGGFAFLVKNNEQLERNPIPVRAYIKDRKIYVDLTTAKFDESYFDTGIAYYDI